MKDQRMTLEQATDLLTEYPDATITNDDIIDGTLREALDEATKRIAGVFMGKKRRKRTLRALLKARRRASGEKTIEQMKADAKAKWREDRKAEHAAKHHADIGKNEENSDAC